MLGNMIRGWNGMSTYHKFRRIFMIGLALFGLWALTPYLYNRRVDEAFPAPAPASQAVVVPTAALAMPEKAAPTAAAMVGTTAMADSTAPTAAAMVGTTAMADSTAPTAAAMVGTTAMAVTAAPAEPVALTTGTFIAGSTPGDKAGGKATIYRIQDGTPLLRLEDFSTTNGPDLFVVLSSSANPDQDGLKSAAYLQLDALKGNVGNQNYDLPANIDLRQYKSVVIWCRTFNVVFGYAALQSAS